jgi:tRNA threonylcarbamoyladenosine biosynthesis protein TsaE
MRLIEEFVSGSEEETVAWAVGFSARLKAGDTVALSGNLGAGKTVVSRGVARGLGFGGDVHSPSYALVHEYPGARLPLFHMDLYRLKEGADWEEIGLDHYFQQGGVCLVEWPERLPAGVGFAYRIEITAEGESGRRVRVTGG